MTCGLHIPCGRLRASNRDAADGAVGELERIVGKIRQRWPEVRVASNSDDAGHGPPSVSSASSPN